METQSKLNVYKKLFFVLFALTSGIGFSQQRAIQPKSEVTTLENVVEDIKAKNAAIKNEDEVNVMVNELIIDDLREFRIDPKSIKLVEVVVMQPKEGNERVKPAIIINTKY